MLHKVLLTALLLTLVVTSAIKTHNISELSNALKAAAPKRVSFMLKPEDNGNKILTVPGPSGSKIIQSFVSYEKELFGLVFRMQNTADDSCILYNVKIYDANFNKIRSASAYSSNEGFNEVYFAPIKNSLKNTYYFSIEAASSADSNKLIMQLAHPRITYPTGELFLDSFKLPSYIFMFTLHKVTSFADYCSLIGNYFSIQLILVGILIAYIGYMLSRLKAIYFVILFFGLIQVFIDLPFTGVDEGAHLDNVNYIVNHGKLPYFYDNNDADDLFNLTNSIGNLRYCWSLSEGYPLYEAIHPPLYYVTSAVIASMVSLVSSDMAYRFYVLRFIGVLMLLCTAYFTIKSYECITDNKLLPRNDILLYLLLLLFSCSPGYLSVIVAVTNEQLLLPLTSIILYLSIKTNIEKEALEIRTVLVFSLFSALIILTKLTSVPVLLVLVIIIAYYDNRAKNIIVYFLVTSLLVSPWLLYNYKTYGVLQASMLNVKLTVPNYKELHISFYDHLANFYRFIKVYFNAWIMSDVLKGLHIIITIGYVITASCFFYKLYFLFQKKIYEVFSQKLKIIILILCSALAAQFIYMLAITVSLNLINQFGPRYSYSFMSFSILLLYIVIAQSKKGKEASISE